MNRSTSFARPNVPVPADVLDTIRNRPEELGFPTDASEASRLGELLIEGYRARMERVAREARLVSYQAWAGDAENREAAREVLEDTRASGGVLGSFRRGSA